ncbi:MAG: hypothetical protein MJY79_02115 [Bacteroidaceae bacterium]|nr:hypothetical protein [Bacteroidaceae bacterium]
MVPASADAAKKKAPADKTGKYIFNSQANPYLPLWEHVPDGEPKVFEDPDNPGHYRAYIIGSHDVRFGSYCGPDIRAWSAPIEDLSQWRDEGPIFTYFINDQWDVMYAPDLVEVDENGKKVYYLYPHSRGARREAMVCKGDRPDGPFTPLNLNAEGTATIPGSCIGFDPSVIIEKVTDKNDPDYERGWRAYGYWGFQHSTAAQLDPETMYSVRPGTEPIDYFMPASSRYGVVRDPAGTVYPALAEGQDPGDFNFFEASSIRQVGNKFVMIFSGYSGPDYGLGSTNSALRYCYADSPLGPWRSGGVAVDSRGVVLNEDGTKLTTTNSAHNTHGSIEKIGDQWYIFYHRPPRGFGNARQAMVAPVKIEYDEKSVADGGKVRLTAYDPYAPDGKWTAKASNGDEYTGAEVTSEGFHIYGLDPYRYYSAGYACYMSDPGCMQDTWHVWDNAMDLTNLKNGSIVGFKYFGFGGLKKASKGVQPFAGTKKGNKTAINIFITPQTTAAFKIKVMMDGPWANSTWNGKQIAVINVPAGSASKVTCFTADVAQYVDQLGGKHAIYLVAEGPDGNLFDMQGIGFSKKGQALERPVAPTLSVKVDGKSVEMPEIPVRSTERNGIVKENIYSIGVESAANVTVTASDPSVKYEVTKGTGDVFYTIKASYAGQEKIYNVEKPAPQPQRPMRR